MTTTEIAALPALQRLIDRQEIDDLIGRYCLACDERETDTLTKCFDAAATASYDVDADLAGADAIADWICSATAHLVFQQHFAQVFRADIDGDTADVVAYLTSHQVAADSLGQMLAMNSRYELALVRRADGWKIARLRLQVGTVETRPAELGQLTRLSLKEYQ